jgi:hypothetical protein
MSMPSFTAERALYQTANHYRSVTGRNFASDGTTVNLQGCDIWDKIECGAFVLGAGLVCGAFCAAGPVACAACVAPILGGDLCVPCYDCLPGFIRDLIDQISGGHCGPGRHGGGGNGGGGGGGGTGGPCGCPRGTKCCGGCTKVPGQGLVCNDACVGPKEQCP